MCIGQLDAGAVAAAETGFLDAHLLTLKARRDAANEYYHVGIAHLGHKLLGGHGHQSAQIKLQHGHVVLLNIVYLDAVFLASLHLIFLVGHVDAIACLPTVDDGIAVDDKARQVVAGQLQLQFLAVLRPEHALKAG